MISRIGDSTDITASWKKVQPGSIYFDFTQKRNRKELIQAYKKGASIIYTEKNISDPSIPAIKTEKIENTFIEHLRLRYCPDINCFTFIAVTGSKGKGIVSNMLEHIFNYEFDSVLNYENKCVLNEGNRLQDAIYVENLFKSLENYEKKAIKYIPIIIDPINSFDFSNMFNCKLGIVTNIKTEDNNEEIPANFISLKRFYSSKSAIDTLILNIDDPYSLKILDKSKPMIIITYGLNEKAAVNAASIDFGDGIHFNYSLQRCIETISGKIIEPFEIPIKLKALGNYNIYNALASITTAIYYDINVNLIIKALESYNGLYRSLQKIYIDKFIFIDHFCSSISDYTAAFNSIQTLDYKNIYMIVSVDAKMDIESHKKISTIIFEWSNFLKVSKINLTACMEYRSVNEFEGKKESRIYQKLLTSNGIKNDYFSNLNDAIEDFIMRLTEGDLLLILGGEELNKAQNIIFNIFSKKD